jgi:hypothetical protein
VWAKKWTKGVSTVMLSSKLLGENYTLDAKYVRRVEKRETTHNVGDQLRKFIRLRLQTKPGERDGEIAALLAQVDPSKRRFERNSQGSLDDLGDGEPEFVERILLKVQGCDERGHFERLVGAGEGLRG